MFRQQNLKDDLSIYGIKSIG